MSSVRMFLRIKQGERSGVGSLHDFQCPAMLLHLYDLWRVGVRSKKLPQESLGTWWQLSTVKFTTRSGLALMKGFSQHPSINSYVVKVLVSFFVGNGISRDTINNTQTYRPYRPSCPVSSVNKLQERKSQKRIESVAQSYRVYLAYRAHWVLFLQWV